MKNNLKWIGLVLLSCGMLVGCSENGNEAEGAASEVASESSSINGTAEERISDMYPENVKDETVSEDVFLETTRFVSSFGEHSQRITELQLRVNENISLLDDATFKNEYSDTLDQFDVFIKGFHLIPSTSADFEINSNFNDILFNYSMYIKELRNYIDTKDSRYTQNALSHSNSNKTSYTALLNSLDKYGLMSE